MEENSKNSPQPETSIRGAVKHSAPALFLVLIAIIALVFAVFFLIKGLRTTTERIIDKKEVASKEEPALENAIVKERQTHGIDNITMPNGENVLFIADAIPQSGTATKDRNCTIPEIQIVNASLRYRNIEIPLGKIGIPKTVENTWPPMIINPVDTGLINENISFTWAPLHRFGINIIGVIDYTSLKEVVRPAVSRDTVGAKDGNLDIGKACFLNYTMKFFRLSPDFKTIEPNTHYSGGEFENIFYLRAPIEPGRIYQNNCTPLFGCG